MATWDKQKRKWKTSVGTGKQRTYIFADRHEGELGLAGERGEFEAEERKSDLLGGPAPLRPGSLNEFVEDIWFPHCNRKHGFETCRVYRSIWERIISPEIGNYLLKELAPDSMDDRRRDWAFNKLQGLADAFTDQVKENKNKDAHPQKVSSKTVRNQFGIVQSIFAHAKRTRRIRYNPCLDIELPKVVKRKARRDLTIDVGKQLDELFAGTPYEGLVWISHRLALRPNEALGLRPCDVTFEGDMAVIKLCINRQEKETKEQLKNKIEGEDREEFVPREWGERILSYHYPGAEYIFCAANGKPINPATYRTMYHRKVKAAGIKVQRKEQRNMGISNLMRTGTDIGTAADIAGHTSTNMTQIYKDMDTSAKFGAFTRLSSAYDHKDKKQ
jgi:integrase